MAKVHATAIVEDGAELAADVEIGAYSIIGSRVRLGAGVRIASHVVIAGHTEIGAGSAIHAHAVLGGPAQFRNDNGGDTRLVIGSGNVIREHVTMNIGSARGTGITCVGNNGYFMAYSHVAHDCHVGNNVTFANGATLGGHVMVGDGVNIGGLAAVQQFCRIGHNAFIGGVSGVRDDVIPYGMALGDRARLDGLNLIGLKRKGVPRARIHALRAAFRFVFFGDGRLADRAREAADRWKGFAEVEEVLDFVVADAKRSLCMPSRRAAPDME